LIDIVVSTLVVDSPFVGCFSPLPPASTTGFFLIDIVVPTLVVDSPFVGCFSPLPPASTTLAYIILNQRTNTSCITMLANKTTTIFT
jgi:hypothetical protein